MTAARYKHLPTSVFLIAGVLAIIAGGMLSAFMAKHPNTFAMWAAAYLVLVVGVSQVFFGVALKRLVPTISARFAYSICGLFNIGNALVVAGTAIKYSGFNWNIPVTAAGSGVLAIALILLLACVYRARGSWLKVWMYLVIMALIFSIPIGLLLAHQ